MSLNPNALLTPTNMPCADCGGPIGAFYCVMVCDACLEERIPEQTCERCGKVGKHFPRMSKFQEDGSLGAARYWCSDCVLPGGMVRGGLEPPARSFSGDRSTN